MRALVAMWCAAALDVGCCEFQRRGIGPGTIAAEVAFAALTVVDGLQSQNAVDNCSETNPVIGPCGNRIRPPAYYTFVIGAHALAAFLLPEKWRPWFVGVSLGSEGNQVVQNHELGYHIDGTYTGPHRDGSK